MQKNISKHITQTYVNLRVGMAILAFSLPAILFIVSLITGEKLEPSISAYYFTPMRDLFVGAIVAVGACLYLYKGFSDKENIALNIAGVFAIGVAFIPTCIPDSLFITNEACDQGVRGVLKWIHRVCAFCFFLPVAYVCSSRGKDTVELIEDEKVRKKYLKLYRFIGPMMIVLPAVSALYFCFKNSASTIFYVETVAIWVFAVFWLTKVMELKHHKILPELHALDKFG